MCVCCCLLMLLFTSINSVRILSRSELRCSTQDLRCTVNQTNCMDPGGLKFHPYTPSGPEGLEVSVEVRQDEAGRLQPVLRAQWTLRDDGSIRYLDATELHVLVLSTNQNLCLRYSFQDSLSMRSPSGKKWGFSADMLVLDPGLQYKVSVFNVPRPALNHTWYDVSRDVTVPDCEHPRMHLTQFCIERGSLWRPNISVAVVGGGWVLAVSFLSDPQCDHYLTIVTCSEVQRTATINKDGRTTLNSTFSLDQWPRSCCHFKVEIKPLFVPCGEDCRRVSRTADVCPEKPPAAPDVRPYSFVVVGVVFLCVGMAAAGCLFCRKSGTSGARSGGKPPALAAPARTHVPKVLVIYSQDHPLYRDVVLKLCAFLQARCGTKVVVDLLDSTSISVVGRLRWLECQRQQLRDPAHKILVLCSRGVQAKWRAMCGQERVTLRQDVLSPTDDMLTPFLSLFLPSMHHSTVRGKFLVAYFEDVSGEQDVPSVFHIAVKYRLMKHFEDLYFRILDLEKYQPGQVNHIPGVGGDQYFRCPSGSALKLALETFRSHQLRHPDWFERECVQSEDQVLVGAPPASLPKPPLLECVPLLREGPPAYSQEVEMGTTGDYVQVVSPELNPPGVSITQVAPVIHGPGPPQLEVLMEALPVHDFRGEPVVNGPPVLRPEELGGSHTDPPRSRPGPLRGLTFSNASLSSQNQDFPPRDITPSQPVEMEENQNLEPAGIRSNSGSDQGYGSRTPSQPEAPPKRDPLEALADLQEELFELNVKT